MDINELKGKTLDDATFSALSAYVQGLSDKAATATRESIEGRKTLKAERDQLRERVTAMADRLGIEPDADLSTLPDLKGATDATKAEKARADRLARELADEKKARETLAGERAAMLREAAISKAIEPMGFKNPADVRALVELRTVAEGDALLFKMDDGKLVPLDEGAAWFAKTRPDYVKPADAGGQGSGFQGTRKPGASGVPSANLGGTREERAAAIRQRFPDLPA